ncbi:MAG: type I-E CRISPR-associated protein Cas5/CasD [Oscillospiraceae bacterium]|nr:type I-E CRISPR-associated protein Cas5/CasD [Oscillospiraceae bacterium]
MSTLLLRLAAPLQSWGFDSKFERRMTASAPTKSGIVGLIAAALGRRRDEAIDDLARLRFGVRLDQPGQIICDYHTANYGGKDVYQSWRYYISDGVFLVGLEGDSAFLNSLERALRTPVFPLYLGRRSCPPAGKLCLGIKDSPLKEALRSTEWLAGEYHRGKKPSENLEYHIESRQGKGIRRMVQPVSFSWERRRYAIGYTEHDAFGEV